MELDNTFETELWRRFEYRIRGPKNGNPFADITLSAQFRHLHRAVEVDGFYDGGGEYVIRFMPDTLGAWSFETASNVPELNGIRGTLNCVAPSPGNHGPVRVDKRYHFAYADGTPYFPLLERRVTYEPWERKTEQTLQSLRESAFNKIRMCVFPKHYDYNLAEPELYPFAESPETGWDFTASDLPTGGVWNVGFKTCRPLESRRI